MMTLYRQIVSYTSSTLTRLKYRRYGCSLEPTFWNYVILTKDYIGIPIPPLVARIINCRMRLDVLKDVTFGISSSQI